jgi:DNA-binding MarR family transcriptional regulator
VTHPALRLDDTVHQRVRLGILAVLSEASRADFGYLRDALELTDGNLSRHIAVLEEAGLVKVEKGYAGKRPRTWVQATRAGRAALKAELAALQELITRVSNVAEGEREARASRLAGES